MIVLLDGGTQPVMAPVYSCGAKSRRSPAALPCCKIWRASASPNAPGYRWPAQNTPAESDRSSDEPVARAKLVSMTPKYELSNGRQPTDVPPPSPVVQESPALFPPLHWPSTHFGHCER